MNAQLAMMVNMITTLNNLQEDVKEATYFTEELTHFYL